MSNLAPLKELPSGHKIPVIGLGVYLTPTDVASSIVYEALKLGYRHIDSAAAYKNEEEVAQGILKWLNEDPEHNKREDIFYTTKIPNEAHGYAEAKEQIEKSLNKAKGLKYIDLILIHSPQSNREKRLGTYKALQEAVNSGTIKTIGVSNYGIHHLKELLKWDGLTIKPSINQIEISPWLQRQELVKFSQDNGIVLESYSPLTRGQRLTNLDPELGALANKYGKSPAQVLIKWNIQKGYIALPKTINPARAAENFEVFDFELTKEDLEEFGDPKAYSVTSTTGWDPISEPLEYELK